MRQILGNVFEVRDADREHDSPAGNAFTILKLQKKPFRRALDARYKLFFELRDETIAKRKAILRKRFKPDWEPYVRVFDLLLRAEISQREPAFGIVDIRSKAFRLEQHALRHMRKPAIHGSAKDAKWNSAVT